MRGGATRSSGGKCAAVRYFFETTEGNPPQGDYIKWIRKNVNGGAKAPLDEDTIIIV